MTARLCAVPNCGTPAASGYSPHCRRHKSVLRRQGAPDQRGVTKAELAPYTARIEARIAKNPDSEAWPLMEEAWAAIVVDAQSTANHRVGNRYQRSAANEIAAIAQDCNPGKVIVTVLGMVLFWHERPLRFASDESLRVQIARRVRALSQRHVGLRYNHRTAKQVRVYREITPKAAAMLGRKLMTAFGGVGLQLAELDERDRKAAHEAKQRLATAISKLN
ncbi:hypothetical protein BMG03_04085 [Thioclava nitratireducens]|uniref:Uncharacterized protein n=2 Tax=Thioclava nitratireducens TaxID=1915078 RepID=A0ABM6IED2_9RHOB|nr:hypothetical protein BMG03_04085 [Thioclava nitratireducens]